MFSSLEVLSQAMACIYKTLGNCILNDSVLEVYTGDVYNILTALLFKKLLFIIIIILAVVHGMQDLSSPTRDRTRAPCFGSMES